MENGEEFEKCLENSTKPGNHEVLVRQKFRDSFEGVEIQKAQEVE